MFSVAILLAACNFTPETDVKTTTNQDKVSNSNEEKNAPEMDVKTTTNQDKVSIPNEEKEDKKLYLLCHNLEKVVTFDNEDFVYQLKLSQDWKMEYIVGWYESDIALKQLGVFWPITEDYDKMVFRYGYELTKQVDFEEVDYEEDDYGMKSVESEISEKGIFELRYGGDNVYFITPIEGIDFLGFLGKGLGQAIAFEEIK